MATDAFFETALGFGGGPGFFFAIDAVFETDLGFGFGPGFFRGTEAAFESAPGRFMRGD